MQGKRFEENLIAAINELDQSYDSLCRNVQELSVKLQNEAGLEAAVELIEHAYTTS